MKKEFVQMSKTDFIHDIVIPFLKKDNLISYVLIDENFDFLKNYIRKLAVLNKNEKIEIAEETKRILKNFL